METGSIQLRCQNIEEERLTQMKKSILLITLFLAVLWPHREVQGETQQELGKMIASKEIVDGLREKQDEELHGFIRFLDSTFDRSQLTDEEIDSIIEQLLVIQESDPYQTFNTVKGPANNQTAWFPNRWATRQCIFRFRFQKTANSLRQLPLEQRVNKFMDGIENPPNYFDFDSLGALAGELVHAGTNAVPYIVQHKPKIPFYSRAVVNALVEIGDPRGTAYIIEVLNTPDDSFRFARQDAAKALANFDSEQVVMALIETLNDETHQDIDRRMPQFNVPGHKSYIGRYYTVQHAAAQSLTELTGKDWGLLFNEDYQTWATWLLSDKSASFNPADVERSDEQAAELVTSMFHRYMSARPNPWQPQNVLATAAGISELSNGLKHLGVRVVPLIVDGCQARINETPLWQDELRQWTRSLLQSLEWKEAVAAAQALNN